MLSINIGDRVEARYGHSGTVVKKYFVLGRYETYIHIKEADGRIWYCPLSDVIKRID